MNLAEQESSVGVKDTCDEGDARSLASSGHARPVSATAAPRTPSAGVTILRNVVANWAGYAVQIGVAFFLTPFVLHSLGDARYGVWSLIIGLTGYYGLIDLGFRSGLTQYLTRYLAVRDFERMNQVASTGFVFLLGSAGLVAAISVVGAVFVPKVWQIPPELLLETQLAILISGVGFAAQFVFFVYSAVFQATQRLELANAIGIATRVISAGMTVALLKAGYGLPSLAAVTSAANLLDYGLRVPVAKKILPQLRVRVSLARLGIWRQFATFGVASVLIQGGTRLIAYSDALVIGLFMPMAAIAPFSLAAGLVVQYSSVFVPIGWAFCPTLTAFDAAGDQRGIQRVLVPAARWMTLLVVVTAIVTGVLANDFFALWIGSGYSQGNPFGSVSMIFVLLLGGAAANASQRVTMQVFYAALRPRLLASIVLSEALCNVGLSFALIRPLGLAGVALGTLVPAVVFNVVVVPMTACRLTGMPLAFIRSTLGRPFAAGAVLLPIGWAISRHVETQSWVPFIAKAAVIATVGVGIAAAIGIASEDRAHGIRLAGELLRKLVPDGERGANTEARRGVR